MAIDTGITTIEQIGQTRVLASLKEKVAELSSQPEFQWADGWTTYAIDDDSTPAVRLSIANAALDFDPWDHLRNPAMVGLHPVTVEELWDFYAASRRKGVDESGRATIFKVPRSFATAQERFGRVLYISALLPANPEVFATYNKHIRSRSMAPWDRYGKTWGELGNLLDRAITRMAYDLMTEDRAVLVMNEKTVGRVSTEAVPATHQGDSHGPGKGGNYSQKSMAVLTGLGQFGVSRIVFRDEPTDGGVRRLMGVLRSVIVFDPNPPETGGENGIAMLDESWRARAIQLADFANGDHEVDRYRFCTYHGGEDGKSCGKCIAFCPAGALANSSPAVGGGYKPGVAAQTHRFSDGALQFDFGRCCDERGQLATLYDEWMCGRCVSICGGEGVTSKFAADNHHAYVAGTHT